MQNKNTHDLILQKKQKKKTGALPASGEKEVVYIKDVGQSHQRENFVSFFFLPLKHADCRYSSSFMSLQVRTEAFTKECIQMQQQNLTLNER